MGGSWASHCATFLTICGCFRIMEQRGLRVGGVVVGENGTEMVGLVALRRSMKVTTVQGTVKKVAVVCLHSHNEMPFHALGARKHVP